MKLTKYISLIILSFTLAWGHNVTKMKSQQILKSNIDSQNENITQFARSMDSRTDTVTIFFDDMEGGTDDWTFETGWGETSTSYSSPSTSLNIDDDNYDTESAIISPVITLPEVAENELIKFNFDLWCDFPDSDGDGDNYLEDYYRVEVANLDNSPTYFHTSSNDAYSGNSWWCADQNVGGYSDAWLQFLDTPSISIPAGGGSLSAQLKWGIEAYAGATVAGTCTNGWDAANVRISTNGGSTWELLTGDDAYDFTDGYGWIYNDETYYDCQDLAAGWGNVVDWHLVTFDLNTYAGLDVIIRFGFGSDPAWSTADEPAIDGFRIDDVSVTDASGNVLFTDNADDQVLMTPTNGFDVQWDIVFYDYGDDSRPGGANVGWQTYMPGDPFNNNIQLDLTPHAGDDVQFRITARIDDNDDGGNGSGLFIDDFHVWSVLFEESIPEVTNLNVEPGDTEMHLTWDALNTDFEGEIAYDNDNFTGYAIGGVAGWAGSYFDMPFGVNSVTVNSVKVFANDNYTIDIAGFSISAGAPNSTPDFTTSQSIVAGSWNEFTVNGWTFDGDFVIATSIADGIYMALDNSAVPSGHAWISTGGVWQEYNGSATLDDGEWMIRANVTVEGDGNYTFNVYRSSAGSDFSLMFNGQGIEAAEYIDILVMNDTEYCYKVTALYDGNEGPESSAACGTPEAQTIHEIAYDDGGAETSTNVGSGNYMAVKVTPVNYPSELKRVKFYVPTGSPGICAVRVWDNDGTDGLPGTEWTPSGGVIMQLAQGWNVKDVSILNIQIFSGDFYVGWEETSNSPPIGIDLTDPDFRSYINVDGSPPVGTNGEWAALPLDGDFMVRVDVDSGVLAIDDDLYDVVPEKFTLRQNYPNPFNPVTNIDLELPEFAKTHLAIFDITGREVITLINNENLNAGHYRYQVNANGLPSGMYFYRMVAISTSGNKYTDTKKLVLLK